MRTRRISPGTVSRVQLPIETKHTVFILDSVWCADRFYTTIAPGKRLCERRVDRWQWQCLEVKVESNGDDDPRPGRGDSIAGTVSWWVLSRQVPVLAHAAAFTALKQCWL